MGLMRRRSRPAARHRRADPGQVALPPHLGVRPKEYQALHAPATSPPTQLSDTLIVALLVAGFTGYVGIWLATKVADAVNSSWGLLAGAPIWLLGASAVLGLVAEQLRVLRPRLRAERARDQELRRAIDSVDPRRIISVVQIPLDARDQFARLITLANHAPAAEVDQALTRLYTEATEMRAGRWHDPLRDVLDPPADETAALDPDVTRRLNVAGHQRDQWRRARASHDAVRLEWTEVLLDRMAVLDHPGLLDVSQAATAAFITAYGRVEDFRSVHGEDYDAALVDEYVELSGDAALAWTRAKAESEAAGDAHVTAADKARIREAMDLLEQADDEGEPVRRRVRATQRAARLLSEVESLQLPPELLSRG